MKTKKTIILMIFFLLIVLPLSGCRLGTPSEVAVTIKPVECNSIDANNTLPIEVKEIVDKRPKSTQDVVGVYNTLFFVDICKVTNFEQTVTEAFRQSISNAQSGLSGVEGRKLTLVGEIKDFSMLWEAVTGNGYTVGYNPMVIDLSLIDEEGQVVWQKKVKGELGNLYWHGMFSLTAGDYMKGTTKRCIVDAVKKLLEDESFWEAAKASRQETGMNISAG